MQRLKEWSGINVFKQPADVVLQPLQLVTKVEYLPSRRSGKLGVEHLGQRCNTNLRTDLTRLKFGFDLLGGLMRILCDLFVQLLNLYART